jgi:hypothetical protein
MKRLILTGLASLGIVVGSTGPALATHCYVADKPAGAGVNGAFQREEEDPVDTFQWDLPEPAHQQGSETHGILELEE